MIEGSTELYDLVLGKGKKLGAKLKELDNDHNLELLLDTYLRICKKALMGEELNPVAVPFIRKYFGSMATAKSTSILGELVKYCSKEYSIKLPVDLIKLLVDTVQLGSAVRFREIVKTDLVELHNNLREMKYNREADELAISIGNVLLVEFHLLDNVEYQNILKIWTSLTVFAEKSNIYQLMSYLVYSSVNEADKADIIEDELCQFFEPDADFISFYQPHAHIPLTLFRPENRIKIVTKLLEYYIENNSLDEFYSLVYLVPELRNNLVDSISSNLICSTLTVILDRLARSKKRKSGDSGEQLLAIKTLSDKLNAFQKSDEFTVENAKETLNLCCKTFSDFQFSKDFKAATFGICLTKIQDLVPSLSTEIKLLLISVLPFVVTAGGTDSQLLELFKMYDQIIDPADESFVQMITGNDDIYKFLNLCILKCSKDSNELRDVGARVVSKFLSVDWRFMKEFVKKKKDTKAFVSMTSTFNKAIRAPGRAPSADIAVVYQICLYLYRTQIESIKNNAFKPSKGVGLVVESLSDLLKSIVYSPDDLTAKGPVIGGVIVDLVMIFIQFVRLAKLVSVEVESVKVINPFLCHVFDEENGLDVIMASERRFVLNLLIKTLLNYGFHADLNDFFMDLKRLVNLSKCAECDDQSLEKVLKVLAKKDELNMPMALPVVYPVGVLVKNMVKLNAVCRLLTIVVVNFPKKSIQGLEEYVFSLFNGCEMASTDMLEFAVVYLPFIHETANFADLLSIVVFAAVNAMSNQFLTKSYENNVVEIKRSVAVVDVIDAVFKLSPQQLKNQMHIVGQLISKLIFNMTVFKQFALDCREHQNRRDEFKILFDHYLRKLSAICKQIADSKEYVQALPCIVSNCLSGEREPNLPTYHLLSGCDKEGIAFLSTNLPSEQKRRFAITFPNFMEKMQISG